MENDNEVKGTGNHIDFGARGYDPRVGRWLTIDPQFKKQPGWSPYKAFLDNPIIYIDPDGETEYMVTHVKDNVTGKTYTKIDVIDEKKTRRRTIESAARISRDPVIDRYEYDDIYRHQTLEINEGGTTLEEGQTTYKHSYSRLPFFAWVPKINIPDVSGTGGGEQGYGAAIWGLADSDPDDSKKPKARHQGDGIDVSGILSLRGNTRIFSKGKWLNNTNQMKKLLDVTRSSLDLGGVIGDGINASSSQEEPNITIFQCEACVKGGRHSIYRDSSGVVTPTEGEPTEKRSSHN